VYQSSDDASWLLDPTSALQRYRFENNRAIDEAINFASIDRYLADFTSENNNNNNQQQQLQLQGGNNSNINIHPVTPNTQQQPSSTLVPQQQAIVSIDNNSKKASLIGSKSSNELKSKMISRSQFYVICQYSRLSSRAWTTALIYETLSSSTSSSSSSSNSSSKRSNKDENIATLDVAAAKSFFKQLQNVVLLNKRMGSKLKLNTPNSNSNSSNSVASGSSGNNNNSVQSATSSANTTATNTTSTTNTNRHYRDDYIIACSPLCTNYTGSLGRLCITCYSIFFGLSSFDKVCDFEDVLSTECVDRTADGSEQQLQVKQSIMIKVKAYNNSNNSNNQGENVNEFTMVSERDTWFTYVNEMNEAHHQTREEDRQVRIKETANLILISIALAHMNKTPSTSLFSELSYSSSLNNK